MLSDETLALAEEITTAVLGVDALWQRLQGESEAGSEPDQLVVLNMSDRHEPDVFRDSSDARETLKCLSDRATALLEPDRAVLSAVLRFNDRVHRVA